MIFARTGYHNQPEIPFAKDAEGKATVYDCGICGGLHSDAWNGDCREDGASFTPEQLDEMFGSDGWVEVPMCDDEEESDE